MPRRQDGTAFAEGPPVRPSAIARAREYAADTRRQLRTWAADLYAGEHHRRTKRDVETDLAEIDARLDALLVRVGLAPLGPYSASKAEPWMQAI